jgi:hypothetical protein
MKRTYLMLLLLSMIAGCSQAKASPEQQNQSYGRASSVIAYSLLGSSNLSPTPSPSPSPPPRPGDPCLDCSGTGRVGDGRVSQECLACSGTGRIQAVYKVITQDTAPGWQLIPGIVAVESPPLLDSQSSYVVESEDQVVGRRGRLRRRRRGRSSSMAREDRQGPTAGRSSGS